MKNLKAKLDYLKTLPNTVKGVTEWRNGIIDLASEYCPDFDEYDLYHMESYLEKMCKNAE
jgi:hypothetical protein